MSELFESFGMWTHKGGVGKTTMTFHLASYYAGMFDGKTVPGGGASDPLPRREVIVVDMDPQANISEALLTQSKGVWQQTGGSPAREQCRYRKKSGKIDKGGDIVEQLCEEAAGSQGFPRNVSGALTGMIRNIKEDDARVFLVKVSDYNENMPDNLWLLCGSRLKCPLPCPQRHISPQGAPKAQTAL